MRTLPFIPVAAALALAACGSADNNANGDVGAAASTTPMDDVMADPSAPVTAEDAATVPTDTKTFVDKVAASDQFEIESSKLAMEKTKNEAIKDYARQMIAAHTASTADLKSVLQSMSGAPAPDPALNPSQQADLAALRSAGEGFDKLYAEKQAMAHNQALALLQGYAASGTAQPLKDFATKTAQIVESHLGMVKNLKP